MCSTETLQDGELNKKMRKNVNLGFYIAISVYFAVGFVIYLARLLNWKPLDVIWDNVYFYVTLVMALVAFLAALGNLLVLLKLKQIQVERSILVLLFLGTVLFGLGALSLAMMEQFYATQFLSTHQFPVDVIFNVAFVLATVPIIAGTVLLIRNSYAIISPWERLVTSLVCVGFFLIISALTLVLMTRSHMNTLFKVMAVYYSFTSLVVTTGWIFALIAFRRGSGAGYWTPLGTGLIIFAATGVLTGLLIALGGRGLSVTALTFTVGLGLQATAAFRRLGSLKG